MPLSKNLLLDNWMEVKNSFREVQEVQLFPREKGGKIILYWYVSEEAMADKKDPIHTMEVNITKATYDKYFSVDLLDHEGANTFKFSYEYVKAESEFFADAEDINREIETTEEDTEENIIYSVT